MEKSFAAWAEFIALVVESIAIAVVALGAVEAFVGLFHPIFNWPPHEGWRQSIWVDFGMWLLLGLQFALAADIVRSVISPTWEDLGHLAAIAAIRTFLNYFLERDIEEARAAARERLKA